MTANASAQRPCNRWARLDSLCPHGRQGTQRYWARGSDPTGRETQAGQTDADLCPRQGCGAHLLCRRCTDRRSTAHWFSVSLAPETREPAHAEVPLVRFSAARVVGWPNRRGQPWKRAELHPLLLIRRSWADLCSLQERAGSVRQRRTTHLIIHPGGPAYTHGRGAGLPGRADTGHWLAAARSPWPVRKLKPRVLSGGTHMVTAANGAGRFDRAGVPGSAPD